MSGFSGVGCGVVRSFRKRPVVIEAVRVPVSRLDGDVDGFVGIIEWLGRYKADFELGPCAPTESRVVFRLRTLEGVMDVLLGDWVIRGVRGEFYPCKSDIFEATYELVD